jgi:peptide/nickel transport system substrate-binding protein
MGKIPRQFTDAVGATARYAAKMSAQWLARMVILTLVLLSAACSDRQAASVTTLTFTGPGVEPDTLNPLLTQESDVADFALLYMPVLLQTDDRGRLVPEIATAVPTRQNGGISADGRTIVYHLRSGIVWQDGAPLTAADVVFTYRAVMNPRNNVGSRIGYDRIASVDAEGAQTVVLHLKRPYAPIISLFGNYPSYPILPAHVLSHYPDINTVPFNSLPIGAGPYRVVSWERGDRITLEANPRYWRGTPSIGRLIFRFIPNANTAVWQLRTGELDAWFNADPNVLPELRQLSINVQTSAMNDIHLLLLNLRDPILADVRVRRAIAASLDRALIIRAVVHGLGIPVDGDQPTFSWAYHAVPNATRFDPSEAAARLNAAGWKLGPDGIRYRNGQPLRLQISGTTDVTAWSILAPLLQEELRRVGIAATLKTYPPSLYFAAAAGGGVLRSGKYQIAYDAHLLGSDPDDEQYYGCGEFAPGGANYVYWCDRAADAAMNRALASYDRAQRTRDYAIVQERMAAELPIIPLWEVRRLDAFHAPIIGFAPSPAGPTFWNAWSWRILRP